jgi:hypothetical protein
LGGAKSQESNAMAIILDNTVAGIDEKVSAVESERANAGELKALALL